MKGPHDAKTVKRGYLKILDSVGISESSIYRVVTDSGAKNVCAFKNEYEVLHDETGNAGCEEKNAAVNGRTALMVACDIGVWTAAAILLCLGAEKPLCDPTGNGLLHLAAQKFALVNDEATDFRMMPLPLYENASMDGVVEEHTPYVLIEGVLEKSKLRKDTFLKFAKRRSKAKWTRRYFVLRCGDLPDAFFLDQFSDASPSSKIRKTFDMERVSQVDTNVSSKGDNKNWIFSIHFSACADQSPKHSVLYLAAYSEKELMLNAPSVLGVRCLDRLDYGFV
ncbi:hypothetical protein Tcan_18581 [Toxocara canis]|uniref:Uncharacterized protein n=1 Tax=Toxocara canis TaxID=6265 RepID=A0A0B2VFU6_TOXCA|nr:hypothetical protein Tcan_18581 [Toxocara canis]